MLTHSYLLFYIQITICLSLKNYIKITILSKKSASQCKQISSLNVINHREFFFIQIPIYLSMKKITKMTILSKKSASQCKQIAFIKVLKQ